MINDFDLLLKKCKARAFKRAVYVILRIVGYTLLLGIGLIGYLLWTDSKIFLFTHTQTPVSIVKTPPVEINNTLVVDPIAEVNNSLPVAVVPSVTRVPKSNQPETIEPLSTEVPVSTAPVKTVSQSSLPAAPTKNNRILAVSNASNIPSTPAELYQRSPKFETALSIAHDFYAKENYSEAAIWAKKANQMNREAEEAWLLYAKSYYAQGNKNEAIGVLELYLNYKDSKAAAELVKAWR